MYRIAIVAVAAVTVAAAAAKYLTASAPASEAGRSVVSDVVRDPAALCRELAPQDPYEEDAKNGEEAFAACEEAVAARPDDGDLTYLAATSALQAGRHPDEAITYFEKAQALGNCQAHFFLAEDAWYGRHDADRAQDLYTRGADCGDSRAARAIFQPEMFRDSNYGDQLAALYRSDVTALNLVRPATASYAIGLYTAMGESYNGDKFQTCWAGKNFRGGDTLYRLRAAERFDAGNFVENWIYDSLSPYAAALFFPEFGTKGLDEIREVVHQAGRGDLIRLTSVTTCDSLLMAKIVAGIEAFSAAKKSLFEIIKERRNDVHSMDDLRGLVIQQRS